MPRMPAKLQIKLLSSHGELLNVVTCYGGHISVFRANSANDLKPYQRALTGAHGPERFSINVDGGEYAAQEHILIGFGERLPPGMTVTSFLESAGIPSGSIESTLLSYGLDHVIERDCSTLSEDEKRRLQIITAIYHPERILILNEPFDPISTTWRERFADLLSNFVRQKKALVVVTGLSYRPECWIDNESVARIQVGESLQRTVGFSGNSADIKELVKQIRQENPVPPEAQPTQKAASTSGAATAGTAISASSLVTGISEVKDPLLTESLVAPAAAPLKSNTFSLGSILARYPAAVRYVVPLIGAAGAAVVGTMLLKPGNAPDNLATNTGPMNLAVQGTIGIIAIPENVPTSVALDVPAPPVPPTTSLPPAAPQFVLDEYPESVRLCLLDTMNGVIPEANVVVSDQPPLPKGADGVPPPPGNGNIFKLLESASSKLPDRPGPEGPYGDYPPQPPGPPAYGDFPPPPDSYQPPPLDDAEEQAKREAIRQKFLEAIRAAAERRAAEGQ